MLITPTTKSITEYAITLSQADAELAMADPYSFGDKLAEQLRGAGVTAPNGNGRAPHKPGKASQFTINPRGPRGREAKAVPKAGKHRKVTATCQVCGKGLTSPAMLARHLRQKHGQAAPASAAASSSTD